jgi:quinol monooxygenase YgiN
MKTNTEEMTQADQQIVMLVTFKVKPEMHDVFKQSLLHDITQARQESGYISMHLFAAKDDPNTLFLLERWQNQLALDNHFTQPYTKTVLKLAETALIHPLEIHQLAECIPSLQAA